MPRHNHSGSLRHQAPDAEEVGEIDVDGNVNGLPQHVGQGTGVKVKGSPTQVSSGSAGNRPFWEWARKYFSRTKPVGTQCQDRKKGQYRFRRPSVKSLFQCGRKSNSGPEGEEEPFKFHGAQYSLNGYDDPVFSQEFQMEGYEDDRSFVQYSETREVCKGSSDKKCQGSAVLINVYELSSTFAFLNRTLLLPSNLGIFHCAVEAYNLEWSFVYRGPQQEDQTTGVVQCKPRKLRQYVFRESLEVGRCDLVEEDFKREVRRLCYEWRSNSYHLTRRNCIMFAEALTERIGLGHRFPEWLKNVHKMSNDSPALSTLVDGTWEIAKWWMKPHAGNNSDANMGSPVRQVFRPERWQLSCGRCCSTREACEGSTMHELTLGSVGMDQDQYIETEDIDKLDATTKMSL